jgi:hypothetical protein
MATFRHGCAVQPTCVCAKVVADSLQVQEFVQIVFGGNMGLLGLLVKCDRSEAWACSM